MTPERIASTPPTICTPVFNLEKVGIVVGPFVDQIYGSNNEHEEEGVVVET